MARGLVSSKCVLQPFIAKQSRLTSSYLDMYNSMHWKMISLTRFEIKYSRYRTVGIYLVGTIIHWYATEIAFQPIFRIVRAIQTQYLHILWCCRFIAKRALLWNCLAFRKSFVLLTRFILLLKLPIACTLDLHYLLHLFDEIFRWNDSRKWRNSKQLSPRNAKLLSTSVVIKIILRKERTENIIKFWVLRRSTDKKY